MEVELTNAQRAVALDQSGKDQADCITTKRMEVGQLLMIDHVELWLRNERTSIDMVVSLRE